MVITGGAGFIGSRTARMFHRQHQLLIVDDYQSGEVLQNGNRRTLGHPENLKGIQAEVFCGSITVDSTLQVISAFKPDIIFHFAAVSDTSAVEADGIYEVNVTAFARLIDLSHRLNARLIYAGSAAVYGNALAPQQVWRDEYPLSVYAETKWAMDQEARKYFNRQSLVGLRYFNVYGPGEFYKGKTASLILQIAMHLLSGQSPRLFAGSDQVWRDFVYVDDVVACNQLALSLPSGVYQVGTGTSRTFQEVADILQQQLGTSLPCVYFPNPHPEVYQFHTCAARDTAFSKVSFRTIEEGIRAYLPEIIRYVAEVR